MTRRKRRLDDTSMAAERLGIVTRDQEPTGDEPAEEYLAVLTICAHAKDKADAIRLLGACGLLVPVSAQSAS